MAHTPNFLPTHDAHDFDRYGVSLARFGRLPLSHSPLRHGPMAYRPPGYPFFLGVLYKAFGLHSRIVMARVAQAITGTAAVALMAALGWLLWAPAVGLVASAIGAVYPPLVYLTESMYAEGLFIPLFLASLACALMFRRKPERLRWVVASGALFGLAVLVRANAVLMLPALALLVWGGRRALGPPALGVLCALLVLTPWTVRNELVLHHFVPVTTELGNTLAGTYNDVTRLAHDRPAAWIEPRLVPGYSHLFHERGLSDVSLDRRLQSAAFHYIGGHPSYLLEVLRWNTARLFELGGFAEARIGGATLGIGPQAAALGSVAFWALAVLALGGLATRRVRHAPKALWLLPLAWYLSVVFLNAEPPRFRAGIDPFVILLAALAVCALAERALGAVRRRGEAPALASTIG